MRDRVNVDRQYINMINAGDESNEHPVQALLDFWMILRILRSVDGRVVALAGI